MPIVLKIYEYVLRTITWRKAKKEIVYTKGTLYSIKSYRISKTETHKLNRVTVTAHTELRQENKQKNTFIDDPNK
jgi:hypothetical protein